MQPLAGLTVVTLEHAIAGPFATRQLADLGARVIKVERPGSGDFARGYDDRVRGLASHFVWTNRSKESLTLDVKHPDGAKALERLVLDKADVVVQNLAPGAAARLGLGLRTAVREEARDHRLRHLRLRRRRPLPRQEGLRPAHPERGRVPVGDRDRRTSRPRPDRRSPTSPPGCTPTPTSWPRCCSARRPARGQHIDVSMLESLAEWTTYPLYYAFDGAPPPPRTGAAHATIYPYGPFPTGDGGTVMLGLQNEREWASFCEVVLQQPELASDPRFAGNARRGAERDALRADHRRGLRRADRPAGDGPAGGGADRQRPGQHHARRVGAPAAEGPRPLARGGHVGGPVPALLPPGSWDVDPRMDPVPALGEHTDAILVELGYDAERDRSACARRGRSEHGRCPGPTCSCRATGPTGSTRRWPAGPTPSCSTWRTRSPRTPRTPRATPSAPGPQRPTPSDRARVGGADQRRPTSP